MIDKQKPKTILTKRMMGVNYEIWFELLGLCCDNPKTCDCNPHDRRPTKTILTDEVAETILSNLKSAMRMPGEKND